MFTIYKRYGIITEKTEDCHDGKVRQKEKHV